MQKQLDLLRTTAGSVGEQDLEALLAAAAIAWPADRPPTEALAFEPGRLTLSAQGWSPTQIDNFRTQLRSDGWQLGRWRRQADAQPRQRPRTHLMARFENSSGEGFAAQLSQAKHQALARWQSLGERERFALATVGLLLGLLLAWSILLGPALRTLKTTPAELDKLELQLQLMQAQAQEARVLRAAPVVPPAQAQAALTASVQHLGAAARLNVAGDRAIVTLTGVAPELLQGWLGEVRSAARARRSRRS